MNCLDVQVSCFRSYRESSNPKKVNLFTWLRSDQFRKTVLSIRGELDKAERDKLKAALPAVTPSGLFRHRSEKGLVRHSGLICLDIDFKGNEHIENFSGLKAELSKLPNVAYCGLSVSGQGYFLLVPIASPDKHKEHFEALTQIFRQQWGICLDEACKDVSRLRGASFDDKAYFNPEAITFHGLAESSPARPEAHTRAIKGNHHTTGNGTRERVEALVNIITDSCLDITAPYKRWFQIAASLANEFNEEGRQYFHAISQFHPGYNRKEADLQYDACLKTRYGYSIGTFFQVCKDFGLVTGTPHVCLLQSKNRVSEPR